MLYRNTEQDGQYVIQCEMPYCEEAIHSSMARGYHILVSVLHISTVHRSRVDPRKERESCGSAGSASGNYLRYCPK
jgi:hypothetical protein